MKNLLGGDCAVEYENLSEFHFSGWFFPSFNKQDRMEAFS